MIIENLKKETEPSGFPSIFNALQVCVEYLFLMDKLNSDIVFFYSSQNSFDRGNVYNVIETLVEMKTEIHFFTFENPFELMQTITTLTGGVLYKSNDMKDIDTFMNYIIFKKSLKMKTPFRLQFPNFQISDSHNILCWCHNQLNNSYYQCGDCLSVYCNLPTLCKNCSIPSLVVNDLSLYQLKNINLNPQLTESLDFINLSSLYNDFYHDKTIKFSEKKTKFNIEEYYDFRSKYLENIKTTNRKELTRSISLRSEISQKEVDKEVDSVFNQVKVMILFIKYILGDKVYSNIDKSILFKNNLEEFSMKSVNFYLKDSVYCIGCEVFLDKSKLKSILNFKQFLLCMKCGEIHCQNCTEYLKSNNLGCLNCSNL